MKDRIIERLLSQGHITIERADAIINNRSSKASIIADLRYDSIITDWEAVILLKDNETLSMPFEVPHQTFPIMPHMPYQTPGTGNPPWTVTCTCDSVANKTT